MAPVTYPFHFVAIQTQSGAFTNSYNISQTEVQTKHFLVNGESFNSLVGKYDLTYQNLPARRQKMFISSFGRGLHMHFTFRTSLTKYVKCTKALKLTTFKLFFLFKSCLNFNDILVMLINFH